MNIPIPKVKICGIRTLEAARVSMEAGADYLGFNFVPTSKRFIDPEKAMDIIAELLGPVKIVGVFQNETIERIQEIIELLKLDFVQLHGEETSELGELTQYAGVIKAFKLPAEFPVEETLDAMDTYDVDFVMVDRKKQGEGETLNLGKVRLLTARKKVFLAGGLSPENVSEAVQVAQPFAVDVAGGIETDGEQDSDRIKKFISRAKGAV